MSSSPRRSAPDASFDNDLAPDDQGTMQDIAISGITTLGTDGGVPESQPDQSGPTVLDKSALRRYSGWITLVVASSIAYTSLTVEKFSNDKQGERLWCFIVLATTMVFSIGITGCFIAPDCNPCTKAFVSSSSHTGRFFELFISLVLFLLWCICLPIIMNPANGIAVGKTQIVNANLYVASWVCFGSLVFLVGDLMGDFFAGPQGTTVGLSRLDPETGEYVTTAPFSTVDYKRLWETRRGKWFALATISGIALSASVRTFQAFDCSQDASKSLNTCIDSKYAITMTVIGCILSLIMVGIGSVGGNTKEKIEKIGAVLTTIVWTIGLAVITFGEGPGHSLGNLFFATWGGFGTSVMITADCFRDSITQRAKELVGNNPSNSENDQIELGAIGDDSDI